MILKGTIFRKVLFITVVSSVIAGGIVLATALWQQAKTLEENLIETNKLLAEVAAEAVEAGYIAHQWPFDTLKQISESRDVNFLWVVKPDGEIYLADDPEVWGKRINDPSLGSQEPVIKDTLSYKTHEKIKVIVHPLAMGETSKRWSLYLGVSLESAIAARNRMIGSSVGVFIIIIALASLFSSRLAKGVTKPLEYLTEGVRFISKGNLGHRIQLKTGDEIEELGNDFNQMAVELENKIKETENARDQLAEANKELRIEITERKRAEEALRESEEKLRLMFKSASDGIAVIDLAGVITEANERMVEMHGFGSKNELLGRNSLDLIAPRDRERAMMGLQKALVTQDVTEPGEYMLLKVDGSEFPCELSTGMLYDASGNAVGIVTVVRDITERKRAEEELREMREELIRSEKLAAIGQLAGGVGHELRNPLGAIKNAAYYVKGKVAKSELAQKEPRVIEFLNIMEDEINASTKIISDLLGFSRVGKPSVSPTQIKNVIEDALSRTSIPENIELIKKLDTELPQVEIDADQIHQVLVNMISNAVQAMAEGGKLTIAAREKESFLEVKIADTGCGIPEEAVNKIFDPLFTTRAKGIGLGLAVCKAIIDRHEGNMEVKSQLGKGTTFTISLPLKRE